MALEGLVMTRRASPIDPNADVPGSGPSNQGCDDPANGCRPPCPDMAMELESDFVRLHTDKERPTVKGHIRATSPASSARAALTNPDGRLRFPGPDAQTTTVSLPNDGSWADFEISGEVASQAAGDTIIEAHCTTAAGPKKASKQVTVCALNIVSEAELTYPADRARTRLAVTEKVKLTAKGALGDVAQVQWSITTGHGTLSVQTGESVTYTAHEIEETATIEARDSVGCRTEIKFDVVCDYLITPTILSAIFTAAPAARIDDMTLVFNQAYEAFSVNTCVRRAHFFAQVLTEVGRPGSPRRESLDYDPAGLRAIFGYFRQDAAHIAESELYGRTPQHPADQPAIGNRAYANRNGNGNIASGDGYQFRGRGYLQITGRGIYTDVQHEIDARLPGSGVDVVANPDAAITIRGGMISGMGYWSLHNLQARADAGATDAAVNSITDVINMHDTRRAERVANFHITGPIFHVADCPRAH
jgi:putative chitinase